MNSNKSVIDLWANFLFNEKLAPKSMNEEDVLKIINLCQELAKKRPPKISMHKDKLESRKLVVETAMDTGIDLPSIRSSFNGKFLIGRGLLDAWNKVCIERYGSIKGTASNRESKRRDVVSKLCKGRNMVRAEALAQLAELMDKHNDPYHSEVEKFIHERKDLWPGFEGLARTSQQLKAAITKENQG